MINSFSEAIRAFMGRKKLSRSEEPGEENDELVQHSLPKMEVSNSTLKRQTINDNYITSAITGVVRRLEETNGSLLAKEQFYPIHKKINE